MNFQSRSYFFFAALNLIWVPIIYVFYPETKDRSLESIESMFTTSPFYWRMEKAYERTQALVEEEKKDGAKWSKSTDQTSHEEFVMEV